MNNSGKGLIPEDVKSSSFEWSSAEDIVECLMSISKARNIAYVSFFGGEPLLKMDLINSVISQKSKFSDGSVRFAFTTNAYLPFNQEIINSIINNNIILNISLDGPKVIHNSSRIAKDGGDCFNNVIDNLNILKGNDYKCALISVLDERGIDHGKSIRDISDFLSKYSAVYKINPAYALNGSQKDIVEYSEKLLEEQSTFIDSIFDSIRNRDEMQYIYENNVLLTISNIVKQKKKVYVCGASGVIAVFPDKRAYACYNLMDDSFLISDNVVKEKPSIIDSSLHEKMNRLRIENYPVEYREVELYGNDYCPLENNFQSFAYIYRKKMIENVTKNLQSFIVGSAEHLSLVNYLNKGFNNPYFKNAGPMESLLIK
ncbi:MAG: hypothetical protein FWE05_11550 [Defluviitaleaceae bacterium]|nr:hypothetical protein [Defluviitaleaceae bacterium]